MTRHIRQPGPAAAARIAAVPVGVVAISATIPEGPSLLDALWALCGAHGVESACLTLSGGAFWPFAYVIPSLPPDGDHAAYYSGVFRPEAACALDVAAVTVGMRGGASFFHCHALWSDAAGALGCGHVLPESTGVAAGILVSGFGLVGARFEVGVDWETGFSLFSPVAHGDAAGPRTGQVAGAMGRGLAVRLAPNQDLVTALEDAARGAGFGRAIVAGGVASVIEARFTDGTGIAGYATELLVRSGVVDANDGDRSVLDVAIVDYTGAIGAGRLVRGDNPVLMTFEGVLVGV